MFRQRLSKNYEKNGFSSTPKSRKFMRQQPFLNERNLAICGLILSLFVVLTKIFYGNYEIIFERKLISYEVLSEDGRIMFTNTWKTAVRYSSWWLPPLCGFVTTYFTWMCVYMDSNIPGIQPPSPFSPQKYRVQSGHTFHLNYLFAIIVGLLVTGYMYLKGATIQY